MEERTCRSIKKILSFEKSGETLSVQVILENVPPSTKMDTISPFLETLFQKAIYDLKFYNA